MTVARSNYDRLREVLVHGLVLGTAVLGMQTTALADDARAPSCPQAAGHQAAILSRGAPSTRGAVEKAAVDSCKRDSWSNERRRCVMRARTAPSLEGCAKLDQPTAQCKRVAKHQARILAGNARNLRAQIAAATEKSCLNERWTEATASCVLGARRPAEIDACLQAARPGKSRKTTPARETRSGHRPKTTPTERPPADRRERSEKEGLDDPELPPSKAAATCANVAARISKLATRDPGIARAARHAVLARCKSDDWPKARRRCVLASRTIVDIDRCNHEHRWHTD